MSKRSSPLCQGLGTREPSAAQPGGGLCPPLLPLFFFSSPQTQNHRGSLFLSFAELLGGVERIPLSPAISGGCGLNHGPPPPFFFFFRHQGIAFLFSSPGFRHKLFLGLLPFPSPFFPSPKNPAHTEWCSISIEPFAPPVLPAKRRQKAVRPLPLFFPSVADSFELFFCKLPAAGTSV